MSTGMGPFSVVPVDFLPESQPVLNQPEKVDPNKPTSTLSVTDLNSATDNTAKSSQRVGGKLHRIGEARQQQGISLRTITRRTGVDIRTLRAQEHPECDLTLSELRVWQEALEMPLIDLIEDDAQPLSRPVKERACMVRIMKTVVALQELGGSPRVQRLVEMLHQQLVEVMPELAEIGGWPQHGSRRGLSNSRTIEQQINTRNLDLE
jgi:transcriptional regulator with XRE-family HTH domain